MEPGALVAERFEVEHLAGIGGMGRVYRAKDRVTGAPVALKVVNSERDEPRFEHEAEVLARLSHPGIVAYVAHGRAADGELYLAMEWLDGEDLADRLARAPLSLAESLDFGRRAAEALGSAHAHGVVHRDVKPSNLYLVDGSMDRVKILDFGVARGIETRPSTRTGMTLGTPGYMAPEQARGDRDLDARADVFALGCVLFECVTRRPAFIGQHALALLAKILLEDAPRLSELVPVPRALDDLVARMLAKDPGRRPRDGREVAGELMTIGASGPPSTRESFGPASLTRGEQRLVSIVMVKGIFGSPRDRAPAKAPFRSPESITLEVASPAGVDALRNVARRFGGHLEPLADGSIAVLLSGARDATDQAAQAARCALALSLLSQKAPVALATGRIVLGKSWQVGEAIDRVSRLLHDEARAPVEGMRRIRVDDVTSSLVGGRFEIDRRDDALHLVRELDVAEEAATQSEPTRPFVGRERELGLLDGIYAEVVAESVPRTVLVTAAAGVGKSRLAAEFLSRVRRLGGPVEIWAGSGNPVSAGSPFALIGPALRRAAGIVQGEPLEQRQAKLVSRVARHVPAVDARRVAEFLGELSGVPFPDEGRVELRAARQDPMVSGDQMRRAFEDFLGAECAAQPVVLVLEDLHWGDLPSVSFIDSALRNLDGAPFLVVSLARPEVRDQFPTLWQDRSLQVIHLGGLTKKSSERLVREALGPSVDEERVVELATRAGGNAFYLEELVRAVAEGSTEKLPDTVLAMVEARLEGLTTEARRVLRAASIFGQAFWRGGVAALVGADAAAREVDVALRELVDRELVRQTPADKFPGEGEFTFRHGLFREAAYDTLTEADRSLGHRLAAEWLEGMGEDDALALADHFDRGGAPDRAVRPYSVAAEQALAANDFGGVLGRVASAVRCGAAGETLGAVRLLEAEARTWLGQHEAALEAARFAMRLLPKGGRAWCFAAGEVAIAAGRLADRVTLIEVAEALCDLEAPYSHEARVVAGARATMQLLVFGRYDLGGELCASIEREEAAIAADPVAFARLCQARAFRAHFAGDAGTYLDELRRAAEGFERAGDRRNACVQRGNIGHGYIELGAHEEARAALTDALAAAERMHLTHIASVAKHNLGLALALLGRLDEAMRYEAQAEREFIEQTETRLTAAARVYLSRILTLAGDLDGAAAKIAEAVDSGAGDPLEALALATRSRIQLLRSEPAAALASAASAAAILERLGGLDEGETLIRLVFAEASLVLGDVPAARASIQKGRDTLVAHAAQIRDEARRAGMLRSVPENARLLELAAELGVA